MFDGDPGNVDIPDAIDVPGHTLRTGDYIRVDVVPAVVIEREEFEKEYTLVS